MRNLDWLLSFLSSCRECCCVREMGQGKICTVSPIKFTWQLKISSSGDYLTVIFSVNSEYTHFRQLMVLNTTSLARPHSPKRCFGTLAGVPALLPGLRWWWLSQFTHARCLAEDTWDELTGRVNFSQWFLWCLDPLECRRFLFHQCTMTCILGRKTCKYN